MYRELLDRWCKANPHFYRSTYRFLNISDRAIPDVVPLLYLKNCNQNQLLAIVKLAYWRGYDYEVLEEDKTIEVWCKETLDTIASNDDFRQYYSLLDFKTIEELEVKLALQGI